MSANVTLLKTHGTPAWWDSEEMHVFHDSPTMIEAFQREGLDYEVVKVPTKIELPHDLASKMGYINGKTLPTGKYIVLRPPIDADPQPRIFDEVGEGYVPIQNMDIARALNPFTNGEIESWQVESLGILREGRKTIAVVRVGESDVTAPDGTKDPMRQYLTISDHKDGGGKLYAYITDIRTVCENTEILGLDQASIKIAIEHTGDVVNQLNFQTALLGQLDRARAFVDDLYDRMAATRLTDDEVKDVIGAAYRMPASPSRARALSARIEDNPGLELYLADPAALARIVSDGEPNGAFSAQVTLAAEALERHARRCELQQELRDSAFSLYEQFSDEHPAFGGTAWAAYNAVTQLADWRPGTYKAGLSALVGDRSREKARAAQAVMEIL